METKQISCPRCGKAIPSDSVFCNYCGAKTEGAEPVSDNKKAKNKIIISIIISVIAIAMVAVLAVLIIKGINNSPDGPDETPVETPAETPAQTPVETDPEEEGSDLPQFDYMTEDLTKYVTLGEYKNMNIEITPMAVIDEELLMAQINYDLISAGISEKVTNRAVTKDDVVYISYKGLMDGKEFDGGTGTKDMFSIFDGGGFIDGFAEGIIGAMPGVEVAVELNFPEDYYEDLAGKPVTFMVTVTHIYEAKELTDAAAEELTGGEIKTADELKADYMKRMTEAIETAYEEYKIDLVWKKIFENATEIELPQEVIKSYYDVDVEYYTTYASMYGITYEEILNMIGMTDDQIYNRAHDNVLTDMIVYSVVKAEGIELTDEDYNKYLDDVAASSGYSKESILASYGEDELRDMFLYTKVYESAVEWQNYTVVEK